MSKKLNRAKVRAYKKRQKAKTIKLKSLPKPRKPQLTQPFIFKKQKLELKPQWESFNKLVKIFPAKNFTVVGKVSKKIFFHSLPPKSSIAAVCLVMIFGLGLISKAAVNPKAVSLRSGQNQINPAVQNSSLAKFIKGLNESQDNFTSLTALGIKSLWQNQLLSFNLQIQKLANLTVGQDKSKVITYNSLPRFLAVNDQAEKNVESSDGNKQVQAFTTRTVGKDGLIYFTSYYNPGIKLLSDPSNQLAKNAGLSTGQVLGISTSKINQPSKSASVYALTTVNVDNQIKTILNEYLKSGKFTGPQGPQGVPGIAAVTSNGYGQTTSGIGGSPIVSYIPYAASTASVGGSIAGFTQLSANNLSTQNFTASNATINGPITASSFIGDGSQLTGIQGGHSQWTTSGSNIYYNSGNVGIGTTSPGQALTVAGNEQLTGALFDSTNASGTLGMLLQTTGTGVKWVATSTLGITGGSGVTGGTQGYDALWTGPTSLTAGALIDNGTVLGYGATSSTISFNIQGTSGSTNTIFNVASSSGSSILSVLPNGNVGIGTSSPGSALTVGGDINFTGNIYKNGNLFSGGSSQWTSTSTNIYYNSGNVGIGTTTASGLLTLQGSSGSTNDLLDIASSSGALLMRLSSAGALTVQSSVNTAAALAIQNSSGQNILQVDTTDQGNGVMFEVASSSGTAYFDILGNGLVGINSSSPISQFSVVGSGNNNLFTLASSSGASYLTVLANGNVGIGSSSATTLLMVQAPSVYSGDLFDVSTSTGSSYFHILSNGNVGIGNRNPLQTLSVAGNINSSGVLGNPVTEFYDLNGQPFIQASTTKNNLFIGINAGNATDTGYDNLAIGYGAGQSLTNAISGLTSDNVLIGYEAGQLCTGCQQSTIIGAAAGQHLVGGGAVDVNDGVDTFIGADAGENSIGQGDVFIGQKAGLGMSSTTDNGNVMIGTHAGTAFGYGQGNIILGVSVADATGGTDGGSNNIIMGQFAGTGPGILIMIL